eukprot:scaffold13487_cov19-Tisochrysis_lutea.AAC.3
MTGPGTSRYVGSHKVGCKHNTCAPNDVQQNSIALLSSVPALELPPPPFLPANLALCNPQRRQENKEWKQARGWRQMSTCWATMGNSKAAINRLSSEQLFVPTCLIQ